MTRKAIVLEDVDNLEERYSGFKLNNGYRAWMHNIEEDREVDSVAPVYFGTEAEARAAAVGMLYALRVMEDLLSEL